MKTRPILYSGSMVRAQLADRKTQTRRGLTRLLRFGKITEFGPSDTKGYDWHFRDKSARWHDLKHDELLKVLPWQVGDRLWVKETHALLPPVYPGYPPTCITRADWPNRSPATTVSKWRPAIHMPRAYSRLTDIVTDVRVQRLQEISEDDAKAEGVGMEGRHGAVGSYALLWEVINGPGSWKANPWVVAVTFTVEKRNIDQEPT